MATGQVVAFPAENHVSPPATLPAFIGRIAGTSSPAEIFRVWTFPDAAAAHLNFRFVLKGYGGGGLTVKLFWSAGTASNNCVWQGAFVRIADDAKDMDTTAQVYDYNTVTAAAPSAIGELSYDTITFTNGSDMDSVADGEIFEFRLKRDPAHASDNLANTAYLWSILIYET